MTVPFAAVLVVNPSPYRSVPPTLTFNAGSFYVAGHLFSNPEQLSLTAVAQSSLLMVGVASMRTARESVTTLNPVALNASPFWVSAVRLNK